MYCVGKVFILFQKYDKYKCLVYFCYVSKYFLVFCNGSIIRALWNVLIIFVVISQGGNYFLIFSIFIDFMQYGVKIVGSYQFRICIVIILSYYRIKVIRNIIVSKKDNVFCVEKGE